MIIFLILGILIAITLIWTGRTIIKINELNQTIVALEKKENAMDELDKYENERNEKKFVVKMQIACMIVLFALIVFLVISTLTREPVSAKPIIYLYPTEETEISVTVDKPENFTTTYPKYTNGWKVVAKPDGTLTDCKTGRSLYALYWEGKREKMPKLETGFIVKREDTASFLEEKLAILGLNEREAEEFIVYWLPRLERNPYNWIYFETKEEIDENMKLEVSPKPDTCIRVMMDWKGLDKAISVPEQTLEKQERSGYTVVEWGGTEIK